MKRNARFFAATFLLLASPAMAHVRVLPFSSKTGGQQTYTMKVPTEVKVPTTSVELEIPAGVSIISIADPAETRKLDGRIVSITWKTDIAPDQSRDFNFVAINPKTDQDMAWKAHQHYADGTSRDWVDAPKTKSPASITKLSANPD
ncbi:MAG TPA: DUF1775 domain-containing protein [Rhizomicrobium sp.]|jgi:uncharacterized protein YcnI|nr:DUF1775 domain-containing protein [Rhizomicrobium sp.]